MICIITVIIIRDAVCYSIGTNHIQIRYRISGCSGNIRCNIYLVYRKFKVFHCICIEHISNRIIIGITGTGIIVTRQCSGYICSVFFCPYIECTISSILICFGKTGHITVFNRLTCRIYNLTGYGNTGNKIKGNRITCFQRFIIIIRHRHIKSVGSRINCNQIVVFVITQFRQAFSVICHVI